MSLIPDWIGHYAKDGFLEWVNKVVTARHPPIKLEKIIVFEEEWPYDMIRKIKRTNHSTLDPRFPDLPIIVLKGLKLNYLLDGNRRINTWIKENNEDKQSVWVVCPDYGKL